MAFAIAVFAVVFGGGTFLMQSRAAMRAASATLPGRGVVDRCSVWFIGSSSIHKWATLASDMAPLAVRNRGVNGAMMPELIQMARNEPREVPPRAIVFYAGENDIANGARAVDDLASLRAFLALKARRWGTIPVIVVALKPTPTRWGNLPEQTVFNDAVGTLAAQTRGLTFVDIVPLFLVDHRPGAFYVDDGIHLNPAGYARLTAAIRPALDAVLRDAPMPGCDRAVLAAQSSAWR
ncbi:GDSL-type esterase/lipase family protein [Sphingomonas sp. R86521]|uniref:GDSL-type esterase/lipase family protein n=1 Tax=Sphingomonas sp. R86521 TaxID=3093860 RepID=UPI0036D2470C